MPRLSMIIRDVALARRIGWTRRCGRPFDWEGRSRAFVELSRVARCDRWSPGFNRNVRWSYGWQMTRTTSRGGRGLSRWSCLLGAARACTLSTMAACLPGGCAPRAEKPMSESMQIMTVAWGPFARQCTDTRRSSYVTSGRSGPRDVTTDNESCTGFSAIPVSGRAMQITASTTAGGSPASVISRFLRGPGGVSRAAAPGDTGLMAQGSDSPELAQTLVAEIGVTHEQTITPDGTLMLPIRLEIEGRLDVVLSCRPDGGSVDHGRETLVFSCTLDDHVHTDRLDGRLQLAGVEEVDVLTGVRLSSALSGSMTGHGRVRNDALWRPIDYHVWYGRKTEFE
jgi:hypothetical protein